MPILILVVCAILVVIFPPAIILLPVILGLALLGGIVSIFTNIREGNHERRVKELLKLMKEREAKEAAEKPDFLDELMARKQQRKNK
jgi:hypothetical protein